MLHITGDMHGTFTRHSAEARRRLVATPAAKPCPHLGSIIPGDMVTIKTVCVGCGGVKQTSQQTYPVYACELHGRCLPGYSCAKKAIVETYLAGDVTKDCYTCEDNPLRRFSQTIT